jgi:hypothetical protein
MKLITDEEIARLAELESKATAGEWRVSMSGYGVKSNDADVPIVASIPSGVNARPVDIERWLPNADFIADMRTQTPRLLDSLRRLKEALAIARRWMNNPEPGNSSYHWEMYADEQSIRELVGDDV